MRSRTESKVKILLWSLLSILFAMPFVGFYNLWGVILIAFTPTIILIATLVFTCNIDSVVRYSVDIKRLKIERAKAEERKDAIYKDMKNEKVPSSLLYIEYKKRVAEIDIRNLKETLTYDLAIAQNDIERSITIKNELQNRLDELNGMRQGVEE